MVVTATRTPEPESQTLASVTVIDRAEIERRQARSVPDLLRGLAGVSVSASGGPGQPASVFLRGTDADQVLILIDGVKVGAATLGSVQLENLPIAQIERVELVRGPRSSLYGSEAIGGVIQIFTRKGGGALTPRFSVGAGDLRHRDRLPGSLRRRRSGLVQPGGQPGADRWLQCLQRAPGPLRRLRCL